MQVEVYSKLKRKEQVSTLDQVLFKESTLCFKKFESEDSTLVKYSLIYSINLIFATQSEQLL